MMANVVLQCTVCGKQNTVPRMHSNMLQKDGASTFCSTCNGVTQQKVSGSTQPAGVPEASPAPTAPGGQSGTALGGAQGGAIPSRLSQPSRVTPQNSGIGPAQGMTPPRTQVQPSTMLGGGGGASTTLPAAAGVGAAVPNSGDQLWQKLVGRLQENNLSLDDVYRCDDATQARLLGSLNFDPVTEQPQLSQLIAAKNPIRRSGAGGASGLQPNPAAGQYSAGQPIAGQPIVGGGIPQGNNMAPLSGGVNTPLVSNANAAQAAITASRFDGVSPIRGLEIQGENIIARCSVFPAQPAEYWCAACNVLVSSRCHVQGIHKDHPFISLRLAAEAHVRDLSSWSERVRNQLNVTQSVISNLKHSESTLQSEASKQYDALDEHCNQIYQDLLRWKEQLKHDIGAQQLSQQTALRHASDQAEQLHALYAHQLGKCEPLINNIPAAEIRDPMDPLPTEVRQDDWALRILDVVSKLKLVNAEPIPMPRITVPQVQCHSTPSTHMELLKCTYTPLGVRLPDMVDPAFFNFPHPGGQRRLPFTLEGGDDALAKGILIHNGRTLTRTQDVVPAHVLASASQVFFSGVTTWDVHIDRLGTGPGRILVGIILHGTDGEGVVWDGHRIVGPNEGECRMIDERYVLQPGTVLRLHLELEPPNCFLHCFINRDGVAKIPLPASGQGWTPAFSVFGPQDQITVTPTSATQQVPGSTAQMEANRMASPTASRAGGPTVQASPGVTSPVDDKNKHLINSLQQQIQGLSERLNNQQNQQMVIAANSRFDAAQQQGAYSSPPTQNPVRNSLPPQSPPTSAATVQRQPAPAATGLAAPSGGFSYQPNQVAPATARPLGAAPVGTGIATGAPAPGGGKVEAYSPELSQLMKYVNNIE